MFALPQTSSSVSTAHLRTRRVRAVFILPSHYDDDGYPLRYWRGLLPSNTLSCLRDLTKAVAGSGELGPGIALRVETYDEFVQDVSPKRLARRCRRDGEELIVGLVGVQSNMFPRASDVALAFREEGVPVLIGGFHVSGTLKLFDMITPELRRLLEAGVTLVQGEVETPGVWAGILREAIAGTLRPIYRISEPPDISMAPVPRPDEAYQRHFMQPMSTIDTSRGCPFNCSFCTIINVQGHKMRSRSAECILQGVEENHKRGFETYFFTDDNLSRSPVWERLFEGLIALRAQGKTVRFMMQVDTQAWRIPGFVEKAAAAGCYQVFVGMETVNPENVAATGKKQNKVDDYAEMVDTWRRAGVLVHVGYIIGLPYDTPESVRRDITLLKDGVKVDEASFFMMTPLPGSRDHRDMIRAGTPIDADLNNFDSCHETFRHPNFAPGQWRAAFLDAWDSFYGKENLVNILLRVAPRQYWNIFWLSVWNRYAALFRHHPMGMGFIRFKGRKKRRPEFPREDVLAYAWRRLRDFERHGSILFKVFFEFQEVWLLTRRKEDPRWAALAELRQHWADAQRRLAEVRLTGHYDAAARELREVLAKAVETLERLSTSGRNVSGRLRKKAHVKALEVQAQLRNIDVQMPSRKQFAQLDQYIRTSLVSGYEELAIRYVARRRRLNAFRRDLALRLREGRISFGTLIKLPSAFVFELLIGLRFGLASILMHH